MNYIHRLDTQTINSIAAGEVVERPASVAKELIDNAVDAGASVIRIELAGGGIKRLVVEDNGTGMSAEDAVLSVESHATSKLQTVDDLTHISTMGFRGEALASIAAVSKLEIKTRQIGTDMGTRIVVEGGDQRVCEPIGTKEGTVITCEKLFYNTPARFKFLKKDATEGGYVVDTVGRMALARPDISFSVKREEDRGEVLRTPGNGELLSAIYAVFGKEMAEAAIPVAYDDTPIKISGYMTTPAYSRHNRVRQLFIVNGRVISSGTLRAAADEATKTWFMKGRFPALVLNITLPAELIDVNVHPQKTDIRFWNEQTMFRAVYHAMRQALQQNEGMAEPLRGTVPPKKTAGLDLWQVTPKKSDRSAPSQQSLFKQWKPMSSRTSSYPSTDSNTATVQDASTPMNAPPRPEQETEPRQTMRTEDVSEKKKSGLMSASFLAGARYIGVLLGTYLLFEMDDALVLIDQHAAHERILYEKLLARYNEQRATGRPGQPLLVPVRLEVTAGELAFYEEHQEAFERLGFRCERFGELTLLIRAVPAGYDSDSLVPANALRTALETAMAGGEREDLFNETEILHDLACKAAIKANDAISEAEVTALMDALLELDNPYHCPHGRPVMLRLTRTQIEKMFGRITE